MVLFAHFAASLLRVEKDPGTARVAMTDDSTHNLNRFDLLIVLWVRKLMSLRANDASGIVFRPQAPA